MNRTLIYALGIVAIAGLAYAVFSPPSSEPTPATQSGPKGDKAAVTEASAVPREGPPAVAAGRRAERNDGRPDNPETEDAPPMPELEGEAEVAKQDFLEALEQLERAQDGGDAPSIARMIDKAASALSRLEDETNPKDPQHRKVHDEALRRLQKQMAQAQNVEN